MRIQMTPAPTRTGMDFRRPIRSSRMTSAYAIPKMISAAIPTQSPVRSSIVTPSFAARRSSHRTEAGESDATGFDARASAHRDRLYEAPASAYPDGTGSVEDTKIETVLTVSSSPPGYGVVGPRGTSMPPSKNSSSSTDDRTTDLESVEWAG